jgi:peptidoglycan hydrolase-like protein with peptidoglycan-binding domain
MANLAGLEHVKYSRDALRKARTLGLTITSAYRSPEKDRAVGGTGTGYHTLGQALDVAGNWSKMDQFAKWAEGTGAFRTVLWQESGHYDHVHISWHLTGGDNVYQNPDGGIIENGDKGGIVGVIQNLIGGLKVDELFGDKTEEAVKEFQESREVQKDGIVGENTWRELTEGGSLFF